MPQTTPNLKCPSARCFSHGEWTDGHAEQVGRPRARCYHRAVASIQRLLRDTTAQACFVLTALALNGCGPVAERTGPLEIPIERERVHLRSAGMAAVGRDAMIQLVQESRPEGQEYTNEEWLQAQVRSRAVHVMFPRWDTARISAQQYEVYFTFTEIGQDERMGERGYGWSVNAALGLVSPPRDLTAEEISAVREGRETQPEPVPDEFDLE